MSGEGDRRRGVIAVVLVALAVVLLAVASSGARVPLATEGSGGWHLTVGQHRAKVFEVPPTIPRAGPPPAGNAIPGRAIGVAVQAVLITTLAALLIAVGTAA